MSSTETTATADTLQLRVLPTKIPGMPELTLRLSFPEDGLRDGEIVVRPTREDDVDALVAAFADPVIREAGNLPDLDRQELLDTLPHLPYLAASGRLLPLVVADAELGDVLGRRHAPPPRCGARDRRDRLLAVPARSRARSCDPDGAAPRRARLLARRRACSRLRQRRQRRLRPRARARRLHAGRRRALAPETRRDAGGQDAVLDPARRIGRAGELRPELPVPRRLRRAGRARSRAASPRSSGSGPRAAAASRRGSRGTERERSRR